MNVGQILSVLAARRRLLQHDRWPRAHLLAHQAAGLAELRAFAVSRSAFYRRLHAGLDDAPLEALPVVTKAMLMESFDEVVTDPRVKLVDVQAHLADDRFLDHYVLSATSGTTGRRGLFLADPDEWRSAQASYARANAWAGVRVDLLRPIRIAVVSSRAPWHQSVRLGASLQSPWVETLRLAATDPLDEICQRLDAFRPHALVAYASMAKVLADAQLDGRLHLAPEGVMVSSEVFTPTARRRVREAFGREPFEVYAATESATIAAECHEHRGLHLFEDLVVVEPVDEANRPVPPGELSAKILVSVLSSRTQPLIRYEISDRLRLATETCPCGRPFTLVAEVGGRNEDVVVLPGRTGPVSIHPVLFDGVLETAPVAGWQVVATPAGVRVRVERPRAGFDPGALGAAISRELARVGAVVDGVPIDVVEAIPRTAAGKAQLVVHG